MSVLMFFLHKPGITTTIFYHLSYILLFYQLFFRVTQLKMHIRFFYIV